MKPLRSKRSLAVLSGVLLSIPWLVPHTGLLLLFAFVPLLVLEHRVVQEAYAGASANGASASGTSRKSATGKDASGKGACWYFGLTFLLFTALTTFWICFITIPGGLFAVVANALQMWAVFLLFHRLHRALVRKGRCDVPAYLFLVFLWILWEWFVFDAEIAFPWLTLGNGLATNLRLAQWYEVTGTLGGSLWFWGGNLLLFFLFRGTPRKGLLWALSLWVLLPITASMVRFYTYKETGQPVEVVVVQPNIDPRPGKEKFDTMTQEMQTDRMLSLAYSALTPTTDYVFAPETCIQGVTEDHWAQHPSMQLFMQLPHQSPRTAFVFGVASYAFYPQHTAQPSPWARPYGAGWYESYNTALQADTTGNIRKYHKSKLVLGSEKMPYIDKIPFIEKMALNLGGTVGTLGTQKTRTVFPHAGLPEAKVGVAICYESIFGQFCTQYVSKGATLLGVITNDGWWGNTPGYKQHLSYASLRAIETRRSVARSANTGVSALINQRGERVQQTPWWEPCALNGVLYTNTALTPYVRYGDWVGYLSVLGLLGSLFCSLISACPGRKSGCKAKEGEGTQGPILRRSHN